MTIYHRGMCNVYMELDMVFELGIKIFEFEKMCQSQFIGFQNGKNQAQAHT